MAVHFNSARERDDKINVIIRGKRCIEHSQGRETARFSGNTSVQICAALLHIKL